MSKLLLFDFDGTLFDTFRQSPRGVGVSQATEMAVRDVLGDDVANLFISSGGLKNRTPTEVVVSLLREVPSAFNSAQCFFEANICVLQNFVPEGKGVPLVWNGSQSGVVVELVVRRKLQILVEQISSTPCIDAWPQPMPGFIPFWRHLHDRNNAYLGILSSGHDHFIEQAFRLWELPLPHVMLTEDDMRARLHIGEDPIAKPDSRLVAEICQTFERKFGVSAEVVAYFGDDPRKDGELARTCGIPFFCFGGTSLSVSDHVCFTHWSEVTSCF